MAAEAVLLIEADEQHAVRLAETVGNKASWSAEIALVADTERLTDFYRASSLNESGLIQPEKLISLWRNLQQRETLHLPARTLDQLCAAQGGSARFNWAVIDCFPAATLLAGASANLATWDVVLTRVILENSGVEESGASKDEVDALLTTAGYRRLVIQSERHPAVGMALYARNWKQILGGEVEALKQVQAQREQDIAQLTQARDEQAQLATERQATLDAQTKEKAELSQAKVQLESEKSALAGRYEEQEKLAAERLKQINELQQQIQTREASEEELASRQQLMHEEMVRAEAQIDLIKDILLSRESYS